MTKAQQCIGKTLKGKRCRGKAMKGFDLCGPHLERRERGVQARAVQRQRQADHEAMDRAMGNPA